MGLRQRMLLIILLTGLLLRLGLVVSVSKYPERYIRADAVDYNRIAVNLVDGRGFSSDTGPRFRPNNSRAPLYPLSIAVCYRLFGYAPAFVLFIQTVLAVLTIGVVARISTITLGSQAGLLAAAFLAISPISILYTAELWAETEFALFLVLGVLLAVVLALRPTLRWALAGGVVAGLGTLTHPRSLYLPLLFVMLWMWMTWRRRESLRFAAGWMGAYLLVYGLVLSPWFARNARVFGVANLTSTAGINMLDYDAALTEAARTGEDQWSIAKRYRQEIVRSQATRLNEGTFSELAAHVALKKIAAHPITFGRVLLVGMAKTLMPSSFTAAVLLSGHESAFGMVNIYSLFGARPVRTSDAVVQEVLHFPRIVSTYICVEAVYLACVYLLSAYAVFSRRRSRPWALFLASILLYLVAVAGAGGSPRFRVAMMPFFSVLAAGGYLQIRKPRNS